MDVHQEVISVAVLNSSGELAMECVIETKAITLILRSRGIENLVPFGISTSGITLSTLRRAFDLDFHCVVIKDACFDSDQEVHRVLTEKVFTTQATVVIVDSFIAEQGND